MVGTAAGNHSSQYKHLVVVVGGQVDPDPGKIRTDILLYSTKTDSWMISLKHYIRSRPRLQDIFMVEATIVLVWVPTRQPTSTPVNQNVMRVFMETSDTSAVVERLDLKIACEEGKLEREVVGEVPEDLRDRQFSCVKVLTIIYGVTEGSSCLFSTLDPIHVDW